MCVCKKIGQFALSLERIPLCVLRPRGGECRLFAVGSDTVALPGFLLLATV